MYIIIWQDKFIVGWFHRKFPTAASRTLREYEWLVPDADDFGNEGFNFESNNMENLDNATNFDLW